jgi:3-hydroxybutyryl-CoA dehydrogenase
MRIAVLADDILKSEFLLKGVPEEVEVIWADTLKVLSMLSDVDVYFDLLFDMERERINHLKKLDEKPVFINAVNNTLAECGSSFIRINAWPTMLKRDITELVIRDPVQEAVVIDLFKIFNWHHRFVPDVPGMITPRVVSMIINEAYFTLEQKVSTKEEIDIAMKLGTNYPLGPFEWGHKIGLKKVHSLLSSLSLTEQRYLPSTLLAKEADSEL